MTWNPREPWNALPLLPPPREQVENVTLLKACIPARAALAELKRAGELLPDQGLLINLLPLLEARASTEIENIVTTNDRLFQYAEDAEHADPATKEALRYRTALRQGVEQLRQRPLCSNSAQDICSVIKGTRMDVRKVPGTVLGNQATGEVVYTPPVGEGVIRDLLANWEAFLHERDDLDPLIKMAVAHYQFEAIHPFGDGNGRTGRVLNLLYLIDQQLLSQPILYLSRYILQHRADYYRLLTAVTREAAWQPWILYMLGAVADTAQWTTAKIEAICALLDQTRVYVQQQLPKTYSHELVQTIFHQPYCRIGNLVDAGIAQRQTASVYLKQLCDIGVLQERQAGKEKLFVNPRLLALISSENHHFQPFTTQDSSTP
ncbi:protein adenylyltransferase Fic [Pseudomonas sp.]|uniref:protein adenylyltransferase Fic n=1 Tax=Pseudomonas sp. TaxID=306 RepID=UPI002729D92E|nr:Fic family protein [Pseudomonas sp.]